MKIDLAASEITTALNRFQSSEWFLVHHIPRTVANMSLAETPESFPVSAIGVSGSDFNSKVGQTIWLGNNNGSNLGKTRLRDWVNGSTVPIAESGCGVINWANVTTVVLKDEYSPWVKHPAYDTTASQWRMDYNVAYNDHLSMIQPHANMGPPVVGQLVNGSFTASFIGEDSLFWDSPMLTAQWQFPNGSIVNRLGTRSDPVVATFTGACKNGSYVTLTVVDYHGGSHIGKRLIFTYENEADLPSVNVSNIQGGLESGYRASIEITNYDTPIDVDSEIVVFEKANYNGTNVNVGTNEPYQKNVVFRGWVDNVELFRNPFGTKQIIQATTIDGILKKTKSYPVFLAHKPSSPDGWTKVTQLQLERVTRHLLHHRSTVADIVDFNPMSHVGVVENIMLFQDLAEGPLWTQLQQNIKQKGVIGGMISTDLHSNIYQDRDLQVYGTSNLTISALVLDVDDFLDDLLISKRVKPDLAYVRLEGVSSATPLGAEHPAGAKDYWGGDFSVTRGLVVQTQQLLTVHVGNLRAKLNNPYPRIQGTLPNLKLDPVPQSILRINNLSMSGMGQDVSFNGSYLIINAMQMQHDATAGGTRITYEFEPVVDGTTGSAITFPTIEDLVPIDPPDFAPDPDPPVTGTGTPTGQGTLYVMTQDTLGRTRDLSVENPVYTSIGPTIPTGNGYRDFILDPWKPSTTGYLSTIDGIYKSTTLDFASPSWSLVLSAAQIEAAVGYSDFRHPNKIIGSINDEDWVGFWFMIDDSTTPGFHFAYTSNGGTSWSYSEVDTQTEFPGREFANGWGGCGDIVPHLIGGNKYLYVGMLRGTSTTTRTLWIYKSTNGGASWSNVSSRGNNTSSHGYALHCPYNGNEDGDKVYLSGPYSTTTIQGISYSSNGATSWTSVASLGQEDISRMHRWAVESYTQSDQSYYWHSVNCVLYVSDTPTGPYSAKQMNGISGRVYSSGGFPYNNQQFYAVTANGIFLSTDGGDNWVDKTGNWSWGFTSSFNIPGVKGGSVEQWHYVVVPLWTE